MVQMEMTYKHNVQVIVKAPFCVINSKSGNFFCKKRWMSLDVRRKRIKQNMGEVEYQHSTHLVAGGHVHATVQHDMASSDGHENTASPDICKHSRRNVLKW